ncbi:hypothetical protein ACHAXN_001685 [Cyclotella atomus]
MAHASVGKTPIPCNDMQHQPNAIKLFRYTLSSISRIDHQSKGLPSIRELSSIHTIVHAKMNTLVFKL